MFKKFFNWITSKITATIRDLHDFFGNLGMVTLASCAIGGILAVFGVQASVATKIGIKIFKVLTVCVVTGFAGTVMVDWAK